MTEWNSLVQTRPLINKKSQVAFDGASEPQQEQRRKWKSKQMKSEVDNSRVSALQIAATTATAPPKNSIDFQR